MPIEGHGWEFHVTRLGVQQSGGKVRTYGAYQVYREGQPVGDLNGNVCECVGPGENNVAGTSKRIQEGRYPISTQFGPNYCTMGYSPNVSGLRPALRLDNTGNRSDILIHPGHLPDLYLSSVGCLNVTGPLGAADEMDLWDSRARVIALISDLKNFSPNAFVRQEICNVNGAWAIIDGEPVDILPN